jgi:hypothetical protein
VIIVLLAIGGYVGLQKLLPSIRGSHCEMTGDGGATTQLDLEQSANAATIAGVAMHEGLSEHAVVVAYATALQESKLYNLSYGDRDSVGLFQQRPSQGWGTRKKLQDPVYASKAFFRSLSKVRDYLDMPVAEAAQKVQRSADGEAYATHEADAKIMAAAFTGRRPHGVRCWYPKTDQARTSTAHEVLRTFGAKAHITGSRVTAATSRTAWAVAAWAVAHAHAFGLQSVAHDGKIWTADDGYSGWTPTDEAPTNPHYVDIK